MRFAPTALLLTLVLSGCAGSRPAPPGCDALVLDLREGTLNGLAPTASMDAVKAQFPCFTGESAEGDPVMNFGGGVFFIDHDFFAYTFRDYIEVRPNFAGQTVPTVLGEPLSVAEAAFGSPARVDEGASLFDMPYGCLRAETAADGTVQELGIHAQSCATLEIPR